MPMKNVRLVEVIVLLLMLSEDAVNANLDLDNGTEIVLPVLVTSSFNLTPGLALTIVHLEPLHLYLTSVETLNSLLYLMLHST
jgi:hypothetical protein